MTSSLCKIKRLIMELIARPYDAALGKTRVIARLAAVGAPVVPHVLRAMSGPFPTESHPRDIAECLLEVLQRLAIKDPKPVIQALDKMLVKPKPDEPQTSYLIHALDRASPHRVVGVLSRGLKHRNKNLRLAAVRTLIALKSHEARQPLVEAMDDRSDWVKFEIVLAMRDNPLFRTTAVTEKLRRIANSARIQQSWPAVSFAAREVIASLEFQANGCQP